MNILLKYKNKTNQNEKLCDDLKIIEETHKNFFLNGIHSKEYEIINTISVKHDRSIHIIKKNDVKYILKIKTAQNDNIFEKHICFILSQRYHENVIKFIDYIQEENFHYSIYEYFEGKNLCSYIKKNKNITDTQLKNIIIQITHGMNFLHSHNIIHCDLKLDNIIINNKNEIKIIDFDLSIISDNIDGHISNNIFGTMQYIAPESYDLCIYSKKTDVWQIGIILYILITKQFPYQNEITSNNSHSNLCRQNMFKHIDLQLAKNKHCDNTLYEILEGSLSFTDNTRMTINDILKKLI